MLESSGAYGSPPSLWAYGSLPPVCASGAGVLESAGAYGWPPSACAWASGVFGSPVVYGSLPSACALGLELVFAYGLRPSVWACGLSPPTCALATEVLESSVACDWLLRCVLFGGDREIVGVLFSLSGTTSGLVSCLY